MDILKYPKRETWADLLVRPASDVTELFQTVRTILDEVRLHGDRAVRRFTEEYGCLTETALAVSCPQAARLLMEAGITVLDEEHLPAWLFDPEAER